MEKFPSSGELEEIQFAIAAYHTLMHDFAKKYPSREFEFIGIACLLKDSIWKLEDIIKMAEHVEHVENLRQQNKP